MSRIEDRWLLPIEGLVSGFLSCLSLALPFGHGIAVFLFPGLLFGVVISAHVGLMRAEQSAFRLVGFVLTCTAAYTASVLITIWGPFRPQFLNLSGTSSGAADSSPFLTGGFLGAAIVCAGFHFFLAPSKNWPLFALKALGISVACGFLGVFGWAVGEQFVIARWPPGTGSSLNFYTLYVVWQTGAAALLGLLLSPREMPVATPLGVRPA
jgi:hypothetical protein